MYLAKEIKEQLFEKNGTSKTDTGSAESQIALFTYRINHLTNHLQTNKKDQSSRLGLLRLVGKRRRLLDYLHNNDIVRYRKILTDLGIRK